MHLVDVECKHVETAPSTNDQYELSLSRTEDDGIRHFAGWLAKIYAKKYPNLGNHTKDLVIKNNRTQPSWVQMLSYGGLIEPAEFFVKMVKLLECEFNKYHGEKDIKRGRNVTANFELYVKKQNIYPEIVKSFAKVRTFIRIKFLNALLLEEKDRKRRELLKKRKSMHSHTEPPSKRIKINDSAKRKRMRKAAKYV